MMNETELAERDAEQFSREDYLSEAFGDEARLLAAQGRDEWANGAGFTGWDAMKRAERSWAAKDRAARSIRSGKETRGFRLPVNSANDVPF